MSFTFATSAILDRYGDIPADVFLVTALVVGTILTSLVKEDLRRQKAALTGVQSPFSHHNNNNNNGVGSVLTLPGL